MRKLYALLALVFISLAGNNISAQTTTPDVANFTFTVGPNNNVAFTNTSTLGSMPGDRRAFWSFGDGSGQWTPPLANTQHHYQSSGAYNVCLKIFRYFGTHDSAVTAQVCKNVVIEAPDSCRANFERISLSGTNPLLAYFKALPWHNNNKKPVRICWTFGDGTDTCIQYTNSYTGPYPVSHIYAHPGLYEVCVNILYQGGCEARKCENVRIEQPDSCRADFERIPSPTSNPRLAYFKALPWHNNNKKPVRICWTFGDGRDTCIQYPTTYTGLYTVSHTYEHTGLYEVCVNILYQGGCEARKCRDVRVEQPDSCRADFERLPLTISTDPRHAIFKALPWHNNDKKPVRICWTFGDGRDTCIQYSTTFPGPYLVNHTYANEGLYEVCVKILYQGGCEARKCRAVMIGRPDTCRADFTRLQVSPPVNPLVAIYKALPWHNNNKKPARICWTFGDGRDTCITYTNIYTGLYTVTHEYNHPGLYEVCVNILYFGGCEARKCAPVQIGRPDTCRADFERIPVSLGTSPLFTYFKALPWHNNNRKPARVCWQFGDGNDTCINYPENYTGLYAVGHRYDHPGQYEVCVKILYFGGCEARRCRSIEITQPDSCRADFERIPSTTPNPLLNYFRALPWHNNDKKPARICWQFGDGTDTCINYTNSYTGPYVVSHLYDHPGQYMVCVNILYFGGCEARKCREIVVPPPQVNCSVRLFEITPSITSLVRGFLAVPHTDPYRRPERVCWTFGDGTDTCIMVDPQQPIPNFFMYHTYPGPGVYRACVRVRFQGGCIAEDCREVVIRPATNVCGGYMVDSLSGPRTFKFKGFSINNPNDEVLYYRWTFGDGTSALGREVTHTYNQPGNYEVCLYIKTRLGCETRICKPLRVPGNSEPSLHLTPNPVINILHAQFFSTHTEQVNIKILNGFGTPVRTYTRNVTVGSNTWTFTDIANLVPGIYTFIVQSPNQLASAIFIKL